jgi:hypothetical protein
MDANTPFVVLNDSELPRDFADLDGSGGPNAFEADVKAVLARANKVIVAVGGPRDLLYLLMHAAARPTGYFVLIDTPTARLAEWAELAVAVRNGQQGLAILGPLSVIPVELRDRCAGEPAIQMIFS